MGFSRLRLLPIAAGAMAVLLAVDVVNLFPQLPSHASGFFSLVFAVPEGSAIAQTVAPKRGAPNPFYDIVTGATEKPSAEGEKSAKMPQTVQKDPSSGEPDISSADRTVLERLAERRKALDKQEKEINERGALLAAAEKQLEARMIELRALDESVKADIARKEADALTLKPLIIMYEAMKPKDAARIFEKLDLKSVLPIASGMNPKKFAEVLSQIDPVIAGKLTVGLALATNPQNGAQNGKSDLPELADLTPPKAR